MYSGYGTVFDGAGSCSFGNDFARNVVIFAVFNILLSHNNNSKIDFIKLGEGPNDDINNSIGSARQKFIMNFTNSKTKFYLSLHYNGDNIFFFC